MKIDLYEADMLAWFLRDFKDEFIECAEDFGWETFDAEKFHDKLMAMAMAMKDFNKVLTDTK